MQKPTIPPEEEPHDEEDSQEKEKQPLAVIPYVSGVSEWIRKACEKFNLMVVFTKVKDPLPKEKLGGFVYQIPCQVYVGGNTEALGNVMVN